MPQPLADCALSAQQIAAYLHDGYVAWQPPELADDFHAAMFDAACGLHDEARRSEDRSAHLQTIGDNLRARIPAVEALLNTPTVRGALASVLGEGCLLHPHHFVHESTANDQSFHQDGNLPWNERGHYRSHRPNWAMLFYYPQAVSLANGPTEVLPGTQYWSTNFEKADGGWHPGDAVDKGLRPEELRNPDLAARDRRIAAVAESLGVCGLRRQRLVLPAGSVVLAHYDLMHRGCRADEAALDAGERRFMFKFYYLRTADPPPAEAPAPAPPFADSGPAGGIATDIWHWLHGNFAWRRSVPSADQARRLQAAAAEDERVPLAYEMGWLARQDEAVRRQFRELLCGEDEAVRRAMVYAAGVCGGACAAGVQAALGSDDPRLRRAAVGAAGEARLTAKAIVERLFALLETDGDALVRSNAAYALGNIARQAPAAVPAARLLARLDPGQEPDNATSGGLPRSTVRADVAYALANARLTDADLASLAERGLRDPDRYVRGLAVAVLERHAQERAPPWLGALARDLAAARFNPHPALATALGGAGFCP